MYISEVHVEGFRGLPEFTVPLHDGLNVLIGENNAGKTAVTDALRFCLAIGSQRRDLYLTRDDYHVDSEGSVVDEIRFDLTFDGIDDRDAATFYELLEKSEPEDRHLGLHVSLVYDSDRDRSRLHYWGGEHEDRRLSGQLMDLFYHVYLGALRDAEKDLTPGRGNRISRLLLKLETDEAVRQSLSDSMNEAISNADGWGDLLSRADEKINRHLDEVSLTGEEREARLAFRETEFRKMA